MFGLFLDDLRAKEESPFTHQPPKRIEGIMLILRLLLICSVLLAGYTAVLIASLFPFMGIVFLAILICVACNRTYRYSSHGTARWADIEDMPHLLEGDGIIVGHVEGRITKRAGVKSLFNRELSHNRAVRRFLASCNRKRQRHLVRLTNAVYTAVFAPSGAGKNVSIVEPFLLTTRENCIVIDVKGENAKITAEYRAKKFGHKTVFLDPFKVFAANPATFNVLASIDPASPESFDTIRAIAEAIVVKESKSNTHDPHWIQKAEIFITGVITAVVNFCPVGGRSLQEVASIMADKESLAGAIYALQQSTAHGGLLKRLGNELANSTGKELDGILSTANRFLSFLSTPAIVESTKGSDGFDPSELNGRKGVTVYLILPAQYLRSHAGLMRLWVATLMRSVVSRGAGNSRPVNVILDECAQLGRLEAIEDMLTIGRGFGLKIMAIFQSMAQLKKVFPEGQENVLLSNTTQVFFATQDNETAKYVSERIGKTTELLNSGGTSTSSSWQSQKQGDSTSYSRSSNSNWQMNGRELLQPSEVASLDPCIAITFTPGVPPIASWLVRYFDNDFAQPRETGWLKVAIDSVCLFACAAILAVMFTAAVHSGALK